MGSFKYNGISSKDLGLVIQTPPSYEFPERDVSTTHVPGRNGDLVIDNNCYKNVNRTYSIAKAFNRGTNYYANSETILKWLESGKGKYVRLEDSYDSEVYRLATFSSSGSFTNYFDKAEAISVTFDCKPQRFLLSGEKPVKYIGTNFYTLNDYGYQTKPKLTINNIPDVIYEGITLMLTIKDEEEITSSITLSKISGSAIFDSEDETVLNDNGDNITDYVSLNGKGFPKLNSGKNTFLFEKYEQEKSLLSPYTTIIAENQSVTTIKYTPYVTLEETNQIKIRVMSFNDLKAKYQESYYADAVLTMAEEKGQIYTFISLNTIMNNNSENISFIGTAEENWGYAPGEQGISYPEEAPWLKVVDTTTEDGKRVVSLYAIQTGFYMCTNNEKSIGYRIASREQPVLIAENLSTSSVITIYYYASTDGKLSITYDDVPDWLDFNVKINNNTNPHTISSVTYIGVSEGYYWSDKTWIFGKAGWQYTIASKENPKDFTTLTWKTAKKAFVGSTGTFSTSTDATFTYKYIKDINELQYQDIKEVIQTDDGKKIINVKSKCRFRIDDNDYNPPENIGNAKLNNIRITVKVHDESLGEEDNKGYYAYSVNDGTPSNYTWLNEQSTIATVKGIDAFEILYLKAIPTYVDEDGWDSSLFNPVTNPDNPSINPSTISLKVKKKGYYRYSEIMDDGSERYTDWIELNKNDFLQKRISDTETEQMYKSPDETYDICYIETIPETYDFDRSYNNTGDKPDYINVIYYKNNELAEEIDAETYNNMTYEEKANVTIKYVAAKNGFYKWDSNNTWMRKTAGDELLICNIKDDATVYYLESIPQYIDYDLKDLFHMEISIDSGGNPNQVSYIIDKEGYYKYNNTTDWKYYNKDDVLLVASISSSNNVYHLKKLDDSLLDVIETIIIPRWWSL